MKDIAILKSKLSMPEQSGSFICSGRIEKLYREMDSNCAVTICAPAGYGKTTLAISYLKKKAVTARTCWYRLEKEDRHTPVFISHLMETLFPSESSEYAETRRVIEGYADFQSQPRHTAAMLCQEMWAQYHRSGDIHTYLVFDDFQNIAENKDIYDLPGFLLDHMPPSCTILILSRIIPVLFSEKQKLDKNILEIKTENLLFAEDEIAILMREDNRTLPDLRIVKTIEKITEGWVAGIIMICQSSKQRIHDCFFHLFSAYKSHIPQLIRWEIQERI